MTRSSLDLLTSVLMCQSCGQHTWIVADDWPEGLTCRHCKRFHPIRNGVAYIESPQSAEARQERQSIPSTEMNPALGGWPETADRTGEMTPELAEAYLSLPYGDSSFRFGQPGYFSNVKRFAREFDFVVSQIRRGVPTGRLLDVGADGTWSTARLAAMGFSCVAIDISDHLSLARIYQRRYPAYALATVDMHARIFQNEAFDVVTAFNVLHHSSRLSELATNLARVLRVGGRLGMVEPYTQNRAQARAFGTAQSAEGINEHVYAVDDWCETLAGSGLALEVYALSDSFNAVWVKREAPTANVATTRCASRICDAGFYRARIAAEPSHVNTTTSTGVTFDVSVTNEGDAAWASRGPQPVRLSYHLTGHTAAGDQVAHFDNERTELPDFVGPGDGWKSPIGVRLDEPGTYDIEFDLVHETRTWFKDRGGAAATTRIHVRPDGMRT